MIESVLMFIAVCLGLLGVCLLAGLLLGLILYPFIWAWEYVGPFVARYGGTIGLGLFAVWLVYFALAY